MSAVTAAAPVTGICAAPDEDLFERERVRCVRSCSKSFSLFLIAAALGRIMPCPPFSETLLGTFRGPDRL